MRSDTFEICLAAYDIARKAALAIMEVYAKSDFGIEYKGDESPLTQADLASNRIINEGLSLLTPDIPIISEENTLLSYEKRKDFDYFWLIDPLDGTKEFIARNGEFCINIALVKGQTPIGGIIFVPCTEGGYLGVKNKGSFSINAAGEMQQIYANTFSIKQKGLRIPVSRSHNSEKTLTALADFDTPQILPTGSAIKYGKLAEGALDIFPRFGATSEWDTASGQIILEEAGGQILQADTLKPMIYNKESLINPSFIAMGNATDF